MPAGGPKTSRPITIDQNRIADLFSDWNRSDSPGAVLGIMQAGELVHQACWGMSDLERSVPLTQDSVLDIGSTGKQFAAALSFLLDAEGVLSLDDPVRKTIPELPAYADAVTLRHLLHHTGGIRNYTTLLVMAGRSLANSYSEAEILELLARQQALNFAPGEKFSYTNSGYFLLGVAASRAAGKPFVELLRERIYEPLGMQASSFNDGFERFVPNRALSFVREGLGPWQTSLSLTGGLGDGPILTTVADFARWDANYANNQLGPAGAGLLEKMLVPGQLNDGGTLEYAGGLMLGQYRGRRTVHHAGAWAGFRTGYVRIPDDDLAILVIANTPEIGADQLALKVADICLNLAAEETAAEDPEPPKTKGHRPSEKQMDALAGVYWSEELSCSFRVSRRDDRLTIQASHARAVEIDAIDDNTLTALGGAVVLDTSQPDRLILNAGGEVGILATRV